MILRFFELQFLIRKSFDLSSEIISNQIWISLKVGRSESLIKKTSRSSLRNNSKIKSSHDEFMNELQLPQLTYISIFISWKTSEKNRWKKIPSWKKFFHSSTNCLDRYFRSVAWAFVLIIRTIGAFLSRLAERASTLKSHSTVKISDENEATTNKSSIDFLLVSNDIEIVQFRDSIVELKCVVMVKIFEVNYQEVLGKSSVNSPCPRWNFLNI